MKQTAVVLVALVCVLGLVSVGNAYNFSVTIDANGGEFTDSGVVSIGDYPGTVYQIIDATNAAFGENGRADNRFMIFKVGGGTFDDHIWLNQDGETVSQYRTGPSKVQYADYNNLLARDGGGSGSVYLEISW